MKNIRKHYGIVQASSEALSGLEWIFLTLLTLLVIKNISGLDWALSRQFPEFIVPAIFSIVIYLIFIVFILFRFSENIKSKISLAIGIIGLLSQIFYFFYDNLIEIMSKAISNFIFESHGTFMAASVFGIIYAILCLKSETKKVAISAIILNALFLLFNYQSIYFIIYYSFVPFAP